MAFTNSFFNYLFNGFRFDESKLIDPNFEDPIRKDDFVGSLYIGMAIFCWIIYLPFVFAMVEHLNQSVYKIMLVLGIVDLIDMLLCGVYVGFLTLNGWDYFNKTAFVMPIGNVCFGFWTSVLILTNILSFQRVLVMVAPDLTETLFDGKRTWIWIATPLPVVIWIIFCQPAFVYSPFVKTFILSPYVGYNSTNTHLYTSIVQEVINLGGAILIVVNYLIFIMVIIYNSVSESQNVSKIIDPIHIRLFVQTVLISLVTLFAAVAYVVMNYITSITVTITVITHVCYLLMHCFPPIIYLAINKTLKTTIRKWFQKEGIKTTNGKFVPVNPKNKPSSDTV